MRRPRRGVKICATSWMRYKRPHPRASQLRGLSPFLTPCCPCCRRAGGQTAGRQYRPELLGVRDFEIRMRALGVVWRAYLRDSDILGRTVRNFTQQEFANYVMRLGKDCFPVRCHIGRPCGWRYLRIMGVLHCFPAKACGCMLACFFKLVS